MKNILIIRIYLKYLLKILVLHVHCTNWDIFKGLHHCLQCTKPIHLFGCSVAASDTEEGCGEDRICIECNQIKSLNIENKSVTN